MGAGCHHVLAGINPPLDKSSDESRPPALLAALASVDMPWAKQAAHDVKVRLSRARRGAGTNCGVSIRRLRMAAAAYSNFSSPSLPRCFTFRFQSLQPLPNVVPQWDEHLVSQANRPMNLASRGAHGARIFAKGRRGRFSPPAHTTFHPRVRRVLGKLGGPP